jgi:hypothetical protein
MSNALFGGVNMPRLAEQDVIEDAIPRCNIQTKREYHCDALRELMLAVRLLA